MRLVTACPLSESRYMHAVTSRIDHEILAVDEAEPPHLLEEREMMQRIARTGVQAAEAIDPPGFLRARRERPRSRAAEQRDEIASVHCAIPPVRSTKRIAHLATARDCCAAGFRSGLCRVRRRLCVQGLHRRPDENRPSEQPCRTGAAPTNNDHESRAR